MRQCLVSERFSTKSFKTKTKVITTANQKKGKYLKSQSELKVKTTKPPKARENTGDHVVIGVGFASDWSRVARIYWTNHRAKESKTKAIMDNFQHSKFALNAV